MSPPQALSSRPLSSKPSLMSGVGRGTPCSSTMSRTNANPNPASRSYAGVAAGSGQSAGQSRAPGSLFALTLEPHSSRQNTDSSGLSTSNRLGSSEEAWDAFESRSAAGGPRTSSNNQANLKWQQDKTAQDASELDNLTRNDDHFMDASTSSGRMLCALLVSLFLACAPVLLYFITLLFICLHNTLLYTKFMQINLLQLNKKKMNKFNWPFKPARPILIIGRI